jgi:2-amino-4-hydroxy-6-hydroxymethyldihydropteridine diphosphokinase
VATRVGIALGSNLDSPLGDRLSNIKLARDLLEKLTPDGTELIQAHVYQSEPLDCPEDSPVFLNTVIELSYDGSPGELLRQTQTIERQLGRDVIREKNAPRIIDIDILYFGTDLYHDALLTLPHPEMTHRRFVLQPLADIRPELILPGDDITITDHLLHLDSAEPPLSLEQVNW